MLKQHGPVFGTLHVERSRQLTYDYPKLYEPARRKRSRRSCSVPRSALRLALGA